MSLTDESVDRFLASVLIPIRNTDRVKYPLTPSRVKGYYLDVAARQFLKARAILTERGWSVERMARTFYNPSRVMRMSYYLLEGSRMLGNERAIQHDLLTFLIDLVGRLKDSDPYGEDRQNRQFANDRALAELGAATLPIVDQPQARSFHRLAAVLRTYMDAVYLIPHDVGMEMYGPYEGHGQRYFVRDFFNLRPVDLWPATAQVSADAVWIAAGYAPSLRVEFDLFNNPYVDGAGYIAACQTAAVRIDGEPAGQDAAEALTGQLLTVVRQVVGELRALPEAEQAAMYIRCFWRRMAGFLKAADMPIEPPDEVFERLRAQPELPATGGSPTIEKLRANLGF